MNDNIGEQVAFGSNLGNSQKKNEPVLSINDMGTKKTSSGRWSVHMPFKKMYIFELITKYYFTNLLLLNMIPMCTLTIEYDPYMHFK